MSFDEESSEVWTHVMLDGHWVATIAGGIHRRMEDIYRLGQTRLVCGHLELGMEIELILQQLEWTLKHAYMSIGAPHATVV